MHLERVILDPPKEKSMDGTFEQTNRDISQKSKNMDTTKRDHTTPIS